MIKWKEWSFKGSSIKDIDVSNITQEMPKSEGLSRVGECNHCGKCGKPPVMLENPMIAKSEDKCKFYVDKGNDKLYGHCLIYGRGAKPLKSVKDRHGKTVADEQIKWFNENCIEYPRVEDAKSGHYPPEGCGFTFEEVV